LLRRNLTWLSRLGDARSGYIATSCWVGAPGHPVPDTVEAHEHPEMLDHPERVRTCCEDFWPDLNRHLSDEVRGTAVFSRSDGLVRAGACVAPGYRPVEVRASHMGMATSSSTYHAIASSIGSAVREEDKVPRRPVPNLIDRRRLASPPRAAPDRRG
jgi:hypothetical protein